MPWRAEMTQRAHLDSSHSRNDSAPVPQEVKITGKGQRNNFRDRGSGMCQHVPKCVRQGEGSEEKGIPERRFHGAEDWVRGGL